MENIKFITAKKVLSTILLNEDTEDLILKKYITEYINQHGLYHIFSRTQAAGTKPGWDEDRNFEDLTLLKTFLLLNDAKKWILLHGKQIVDTMEENYDRPIVLTIIYYDNKGIFYPGDRPHDIFRISSEFNPTYVYSKESYDMIKNELKSHGYGNNDMDHVHFIK